VKLSDYILLAFALLLMVCGFLLPVRAMETEIPQAVCPDSPSHRRLCHVAPDWVMPCSRWSILVQFAQQLGPERYLAVLDQYMKQQIMTAMTPEERQKLRLERQYVMGFAGDAALFVSQHTFKHPAHAQTQAMVACGAVHSG